MEHLKFEDMPIKKEDTKQAKHSKSKEKKTTDDLIEEYERKINNTIHLLEEEKKKTNAKQGKSKENSEITDIRSQAAPEGNTKSTPEFKSKKD